MGMYETRDLFLVAFLLLHDIKPTETIRIGPIVYGLYERTDELATVVDLWKDPDVMVPASKYAGTYRRAKRLLLDSEKAKPGEKVDEAQG